MTHKSDEPLLSKAERQVWHAVKTLSEVAFLTVAKELESVGVSAPDFAVLSRLEELGDGTISQKKLADSLSWDKSRLSHHLSRMEMRKLLAREPSADGRGVEIRMLPDGRIMIAAARPVHARAIRMHILKFVTPENADALIALARHLKDKHVSQVE